MFSVTVQIICNSRKQLKQQGNGEPSPVTPLIFERLKFDMVDELFELVLGEKGFVVEIRCEYSFNDIKYMRIKDILKSLIIEWQQYDSIPKKAMLAIVELMICLVGGNRFLSEDNILKLEDASIEINGLLNCLYEKLE